MLSTFYTLQLSLLGPKSPLPGLSATHSLTVDCQELH